MPCRDAASPRWTSFQTNSRSGTGRITDLLDRLSQLFTQIAERSPSACAARRKSGWIERRPRYGVNRTTSGVRSASYRSISAFVGTARSASSKHRADRAASPPRCGRAATAASAAAGFGARFHARAR